MVETFSAVCEGLQWSIIFLQFRTFWQAKKEVNELRTSECSLINLTSKLKMLEKKISNFDIIICRGKTKKAFKRLPAKNDFQI